MKIKKSTKKFLFLVTILISSSIFGFFFFYFFKENIEYYIEPDKISEKNKNKIFRLGGLIEEGSIKILKDEKQIHFRILDKNKQNPINIINFGLSTPPIFKENTGIILKGKFDFDKKIFYSYEMIGKHDENYMPPQKLDKS
jgi:cytochrome c-type biogenesis protein CcmE